MSHSLRTQSRALVLTALATGACATEHAPSHVQRTLDRAIAAARERHQDGNDAAALQLLQSATAIDAERTDARELQQQLDAAAGAFAFDTPYLGSNVARRVPVVRPVWAQVLLYLPDRILDYLDMESFDLHLGTGVFVNLHLTRAAQIGAGARAVGGIGWHEHRSLGVQAQTETAFDLPAVGTSALWIGQAGTSGVRAAADGTFDLHRPSAPIYQQYRDYWGVGFALTVLFIGIDYDFHPVEAADFVAGLATVDFLRDDFAGTAGLDFESGDEALLWELAEIRRSERSVTAYREWKVAAGGT